jgi:hypothetical protein
MPVVQDTVGYLIGAMQRAPRALGRLITEVEGLGRHRRNLRVIIKRQ